MALGSNESGSASTRSGPDAPKPRPWTVADRLHASSRILDISGIGGVCPARSPGAAQPCTAPSAAGNHRRRRRVSGLKCGECSRNRYRKLGGRAPDGGQRGGGGRRGALAPGTPTSSRLTHVRLSPKSPGDGRQQMRHATVAWHEGRSCLTSGWAYTPTRHLCNLVD